MRLPHVTEHVIMGTASKFIFVNLAFVSFLVSGSAAASGISGQSKIAISGTSYAFSSEIMFEPSNGGECRGDNKCAAGGAY